MPDKMESGFRISSDVWATARQDLTLIFPDRAEANVRPPCQLGNSAAHRNFSLKSGSQTVLLNL